MLKTIKCVISGMAVCGLLSSATLASAADITEHTFRIAITNKQGHPQYEGCLKFADLLAAKSGGKLNAKVFGSATLGNDIQVLSSMRGGTVDMAVMSTSLLVGISHDTGLVDLPYLFDSEKEAHAVLDGRVGKKIHASLEPKGLVGLSYFELGYYSLHNSKGPITKMEDVKGMKMRVTETPITIDTFAAWGANPVPLPYPELYHALETKIVDGGGQPPVNMNMGNIGEVSKYYSLNKYNYTAQSVVIAKKTWDKLSADEKKIVQDAADEATKWQRQYAAEKTAESLAAITKTTKINDISPAEMARFREAVQPVVDKYAKQYNEELAKEMFAEIAKYRAGKL
jgi:tripartite ATP-independent transporter DctP family solute receptor